MPSRAVGEGGRAGELLKALPGALPTEGTGLVVLAVEVEEEPGRLGTAMGSTGRGTPRVAWALDMADATARCRELWVRREWVGGVGRRRDQAELAAEGASDTAEERDMRARLGYAPAPCPADPGRLPAPLTRSSADDAVPLRRTSPADCDTAS